MENSGNSLKEVVAAVYTCWWWSRDGRDNDELDGFWTNCGKDDSDNATDVAGDCDNDLADHADKDVDKYGNVDADVAYT